MGDYIIFSNTYYFTFTLRGFRLQKKYMETSCTALGWNDIYNYILYRFK